MTNRSVASVMCIVLAAAAVIPVGCGWINSLVSGPPADPDLKGCWSFDEGSGAVAGNAAGGPDGQVPAALKWVEGRKGKALAFDGKNYVVVKHCPCFNSPRYTFAAWTKLKNTGDYQYIVWQGGPVFPEDVEARRFDLWTEMDGTVNGLMHRADGAEVLHIQGRTGIADDAWHHVALTYDGKAVKLYVDGKGEDEQAAGGPLAVNKHDLWIGGRPEGVVATGLIDEVRFYTRALTGAEIAALAGAK